MHALFSQLYAEIRRQARRQMRGEGGGKDLQATELVGEAYLRLREARGVEWQDEDHFLRTVARAMRRALVDEARKRAAEKRGGPAARQVAYFTLGARTRLALDDLLALEDGLQKMSSGPGQLPREAKVIELIFFAGATKEEIARLLEIDVRQVYRDYRHARIWLRREIGL